MSNHKRLLSVPEAAEMLGLSKHTVNQWVSKGCITFIKIGRRTMFDPDDLGAYIDSRRVKPKEHNIH